MVYGYSLPMDFLIDFAKKQNLIDASKTSETLTPTEMIEVCMDTIGLIISEAGLPYSAAEHCNVKDKEKGITAGIAIASNDPFGPLKLPSSPPPAEVIERLRNVLGLNDQPKWMHRCD